MSRTNTKPLPSQQTLHDLLDYNPATGVFIWKRRPGNTRAINSWNAKHVGKRAGNVDPAGYRQIGIYGKNYFEHRLAWVYIYGEPPEVEIDHENRVRDDNRIQNLRRATFAENNFNQDRPVKSTSGFRGVRKVRRSYRATIGSGPNRVHLGYFDSAEEASKAYEVAAEKFYGKFRRDPTYSEAE